MKTCLIAFSLVAAFCGAAIADPIADRQAAMKRISGTARDLAAYAQAKKPYDATAVLSALQALDAEAKAFDVETLFPEGSDTGDTKASPTIWQDRDGFKAAVATFAEDVAAATDAAPQDAAALGSVFGAVSENCGTCHRAWRE